MKLYLEKAWMSTDKPITFRFNTSAVRETYDVFH